MIFKEDMCGWSSRESESRETPVFIGQDDQQGQQEVAAREVRLRAGKGGVPDTQRGTAHFQKEDQV